MDNDKRSRAKISQERERERERERETRRDEREVTDDRRGEEKLELS